jgi:Mrp family chromosome partitioning ATPase
MTVPGDLFGLCDPDPIRRGRQFGRIYQWCIKHDPVYAREFSDAGEAARDDPDPGQVVAVFACRGGAGASTFDAALAQTALDAGPVSRLGCTRRKIEFRSMRLAQRWHEPRMASRTHRRRFS